MSYARIDETSLALAKNDKQTTVFFFAFGAVIMYGEEWERQRQVKANKTNKQLKYNEKIYLQTLWRCVSVCTI